MLHRNDWACVHALVHHDGGDTGFAIPSQNRCGNRTRAAMARQKRWVKIDDATWIVIEQRFGDDLPEIYEKRPICAKRSDAFNFGRVTNLRNVCNP